AQLGHLAEALIRHPDVGPVEGHALGRMTRAEAGGLIRGVPVQDSDLERVVRGNYGPREARSLVLRLSQVSDQTQKAHGNGHQHESAKNSRYISFHHALLVWADPLAKYVRPRTPGNHFFLSRVLKQCRCPDLPPRCWPRERPRRRD